MQVFCWSLLMTEKLIQIAYSRIDAEKWQNLIYEAVFRTFNNAGIQRRWDGLLPSRCQVEDYCTWFSTANQVKKSSRSDLSHGHHYYCTKLHTVHHATRHGERLANEDFKDAADPD